MSGWKKEVLLNNKKSRALLASRRKLVPRGCFYGYPDLILGRAHGVELVDVDGKKYTDLTSSVHTTSLGYQHPAVVRAVKLQTEKLLSFSTGLGEDETRLALASKIVETLPSDMGDCQIAFCSSGSEAIESAMRLVREATSKTNFISFIGAYHGFTSGALSMTTSNARLRKRLTPPSTVFYAPFPYCYRCPYGLRYPDCGIYCAEKLGELFETLTPPEDTGALFAEPIQVHGGIIIPPKGYFQKIKRILKKLGILLVVDEIVTALGRTGKMFAIEHWTGATPDVICMGKPIASGLPLGVVVGRRELTSRWSLGIPSGFAGSLLSCASALASIDEVTKRDLCRRSADLGSVGLSLLSDEIGPSPIVGDIRGRGLLIGVEMVKNKGKKNAPDGAAALRIKEILKKKGYLVDLAGSFDHVLRLSPALTIEREIYETALYEIASAVKAVQDL